MGLKGQELHTTHTITLEIMWVNILDYMVFGLTPFRSKADFHSTMNFKANELQIFVTNGLCKCGKLTTSSFSTLLTKK